MNLRKLVPALIFCITVVGIVPLLSASAHGDGPHLRIAHLAPSAPAVDVYINGKLVVKALKYKDVTQYLSMEGGDFEFVFVPAGGKITNSVTEKPIALSFKAEEGSFFTLAVIGSVQNKGLELLRFPADRGDEPKATPDTHSDDKADHTVTATPAATQAK